MLRVESYKSLRILGPVLDIMSVWGAGTIAYYARFGSVEMHDRFKIAMLIISLLVVVFSWHVDLYQNWLRMRFHSVIFKMMTIWMITTLVGAALIYILHFSIEYSRLWYAATLAGSFVLSLLFKCLMGFANRLYLMRHRTKSRVLMVGRSDALLNIVRGMRNDKTRRYSIGGTYRIDHHISDDDLDAIVAQVEQYEFRELWLALPLSMGSDVNRLMHSLRFLTVEIRFFPELTDLPLLNHHVSEMFGFYSFDLNMSPIRGEYKALKRLEDIVGSLLILLMISPLCLVVAIMIKWSSPGPVLFKQYRTGIDGRRFKIYKFRTMRLHDEKDGKVEQATKDDPRVTRVGAFLRKTSIDELPQFFNVLQGRMSIVGPRPHALAHNEYYMKLVESYMQRHKVKPGITGWAQVSGFRGETDTLDKMEKRVRFDLWYIENWSLTFDLKIIAMTFFKGFVGKNAY
ncbi:undecaprenyl-phosphate glucose phosphotransferase [Carnimonas bestiolae]|uniref:undecaprenyl-phosphate glucose phosphotransferase n=1 Tax=Carnimonas bestiolae TaxID=3402172 RepID=UPI003EDC092E